MNDYLMQFFAYEHLPPHLQAISKPFGELAKANCRNAAQQSRTHRCAKKAA
jgi:hypothetical protein